jgi:hypothetical protein
MKFKGSLPATEPSQTDWERVKRDYDSDAPIPYDSTDPDDGPYDPNDDAAVEAYFAQAMIWRGYPNPVLIQKDGVRVYPDGTPISPDDKPAEVTADETRAKAS